MKEILSKETSPFDSAGFTLLELIVAITIMALA
ncbi:MAG: prepilin-type N-terminal cleavage/methylation domain-containing protein, partial [bacterium]